MRYEEESYVIESAIAKRRELPQWYLDAPPVAPAEDLFFVAFKDLSTCRPSSMAGLMPIPWTAMLCYAQYIGLDDTLTQVFIRVMREIDSVYLDYLSKKEQKKNVNVSDNYRNKGRSR